MNSHAYLVMVHNNYKVLEKCLSLLDAPYNEFYIHVDTKVKDFPQEHFEGLLRHSPVHIYSEVNVNWAGYSQVECEMFLLEQAYQNNHGYYHLLSGADMPLRSTEEIYEFFEENRGLLFVDVQAGKLERHYKQYRNRIAKYHFLQEYRKRFSNKFVQDVLTVVAKGLLGVQILLRVDRLKEQELGCGSQWFSISYDFVAYLMEKRFDIEKLFRNTQCPDEHVIQMMVLSSPFKEKLYRNAAGQYSNMRYIKWADEDDSHPLVFRTEDIDELLRSGMCFARKFDETLDYDVVERLYSRLKGLGKSE